MNSFEKIISQKGEVFYQKNFLMLSEEQAFFQYFFEHVHWEHQNIRIFGKQVLQPRLTAFYGLNQMKEKR